MSRRPPLWGLELSINTVAFPPDSKTAEETTIQSRTILRLFDLQDLIMHFSISQLAGVAFVTTATAQTQYTATGAAAVAKARATALTESPTSFVKGKTFDRFVTIFLENTDYDTATADRETPHILCPAHNG